MHMQIHNYTSIYLDLNGLEAQNQFALARETPSDMGEGRDDRHSRASVTQHHRLNVAPEQPTPYEFIM